MSSEENAERVVKALIDFSVPQANEFYFTFLKENQVLGMGRPPYKIEVITTIDGITFEACFKNRLTIEIEGIVIPYLSLNDLRKNKLASNRYKDLNDLEHLMQE